MDPLPPIPTPAAQRWREFRIQILPFVVFVIILAGIVLMWKRYVAPAAIVGQVETNTVALTTTVAGLLTSVTAQQFQEVSEGDILATVAPFDPEVTKAALAAVESNLKMMQARMTVQEMQSLDSGARLRLDLLTEQTALSIAIVKLDEYEKIFARATSLFNDKVWSQAQYDIAKANRDGAQAEVVDRSRLVSQWTKESTNILSRYATSGTNSVNLIEQELLAQQEQIRQLQKPLVLRSPISGRVSHVRNRAGERVVAGAAIMTIAPLQPRRILAYLRQPLNYRPKVGDAVTVSTRTIQKRIGSAQVVQVGAQMEMISLFLLPMDRPRPEQGLPIAVSLPPELNLMAGEIVEIQVVRAKN